MKVKDVFKDVMLFVGCIVGVSFVTGKEAQTFVGNGKNIALFAIVFALCAIVLQGFCAKWQLHTTEQFVHFAFKKWGYVVHFLLLACFFVCIVTTLATVESSMHEVVGAMPFPLWSAIVVVLSAMVIKGGLKAFSVVSAIAFVGAFVTFVLVSLTHTVQHSADIHPLSTLLYGLFSLTMVLPVCCKTAKKSTKQNVLCIVFATLVVALLLWWVERVADFSLTLPIGGNLNGANKVLLCVTICLCSISGVVANALPLCEGLSDVIPDKKLLTFVVLALAWAFGCFGLDILLKYGYLFVAIVGLVIVVRCLFATKPC
jgi:hypothetical protein